MFDAWHWPPLALATWNLILVAEASLDIGCGCRLVNDIDCVCAGFTKQMCIAYSCDDWADSDVDCPPSPSVKSGCSDD